MTAPLLEFKGYGFEGVLNYLSCGGGAQMSCADPVAWHVMGKPWKYNTSSDGALCITSNNAKWSKPRRKLTKFCLCIFVLFMIYLASLWATQCIASNGTLIGEEWTGRYVGGVGHIIIIIIINRLGCHPVVVGILHVYKIWNWLLINLSREGYMRSM